MTTTMTTMTMMTAKTMMTMPMSLWQSGVSSLVTYFFLMRMKGAIFFGRGLAPPLVSRGNVLHYSRLGIRVQ